VGPSIDPDRVFAIGFSLGGYSVLALAGASMDLDALYRFSETEEGRLESRIPEFPELFDFMHDPATREGLFSDFRRSPSVRDVRFKAVVALAPAFGQAFTHPAQFDPARPPVLILGAEADHIAPVKTNAAHYHQLMPGSTFELLRGDVGHFVFLNEAGAELQERMPGLFKDAPACDRRAVHERVLQLASSFFARHATGRVDPARPR
jgi:predicted dienelactone hydrolase